MRPCGAIAGLVLLSGFATHLAGCAGRHTGAAGRDPTDAGSLAAAAAEVTNTLRQRTEAGEALTPEFVQLVCDWSTRQCRLEAAAAVDHASHVAAARAHRDRIQDLHRLIHSRSIYDGGNSASGAPEAITEYHLREAELWLARAKAR